MNKKKFDLKKDISYGLDKKYYLKYQRFSINLKQISFFLLSEKCEYYVFEFCVDDCNVLTCNLNNICKLYFDFDFDFSYIYKFYGDFGNRYYYGLD